PMEFSEEGILDAVAKFIACDDQVNKALFRNCLVTMRPKMIGNNLPSTHNVLVYLHNCFIEQLKLLKKEI
ncbi:hypothetical protein L208DRAFT_1197726, partial [Tricholoma matsutake]